METHLNAGLGQADLLRQPFTGENVRIMSALEF